MTLFLIILFLGKPSHAALPVIDESELTEFGALIYEPATPGERDWVEAILDGCVQAGRRNIDPYEVLALLRLEDQIGIPRDARTVLAAWRCVESSYRPAEHLYGDHGEALGPMQLHEPVSAFCIDRHPMRSPRDWAVARNFGGRDWRTDMLFSARCVWEFTTEHAAAVARRRCGPKNNLRMAEAITGSPYYRCGAYTQHWALAKSWQHVVDEKHAERVARP